VFGAVSQLLRRTLFAAALPLSAAAAVAPPQARPAPEDQLKLGRRFFAQEGKCRGLLRGRQWKEAEAACRESARLADRFADHRELEKMRAYASVGHALMGQERFREAIGYYARAVEVSRPRLDDASAELGDMYLNIAVAHHSLRDPGAAREWYRKAGKTFRAAYSGIDEGEMTEEVAGMRRGYVKALRQVYELHLRAAEEAGAASEVEEIKRQLAKLP
jgi:tetratricopeptide (TPR) repeat protein